MGRGKVELKRIENKINRQVTFSKRRSGLLKKAHEISVLCDADVALVIFSVKGKLYEFSSNSSMEKIIARYRHYSYVEGTMEEPETESQENLFEEYNHLKAKFDALQNSLRHLKGEELDALTQNELQQLEQQLDSALRRVRNNKNQIYFNSIAELQEQEKVLKEHNSMMETLLQNPVTGNDTENQQSEHQTEDQMPLSISLPTQNCQPSLKSGICQETAAIEVEAVQPMVTKINNSNLPRWLLSHIQAG